LSSVSSPSNYGPYPSPAKGGGEEPKRMKIKSIRNRSVASFHPISPEDELLEINDHPINDVIDYKFYSSEFILILKLKDKNEKIKKIRLAKRPDQDLGLEFYEIKYKSCKNNCIFCFVHQLPQGMRKSLHFKDEDYRLSFLHGNFITLTNTSDEDINRIIQQRLSPLYISVHTTDENLRKQILSNRNITEIMPIIRKLANGGIEMHTQIVLCPGVNDGEYLEKSVQELSSLYPQVKSLALVPVGLTRYRQNLPTIKPVDKKYSLEIVKLVDGWQKLFRKRFEAGFVYASDEFFTKGMNHMAHTKACLDIPNKKYYDDFDQIENGVGMMRKFLDQFQLKQKLLPKSLKGNLSITLVTGVSAFHLIKKIVEEKLNLIPGLKIKVILVKNNFFGSTITVTGLLTGVDMLNSLKKQKKVGEVILIPPNCINQDDLFLDDMTPQDLEKELDRKVIIGSYDLGETLTNIFKGM
jgi:putative radical SAM enzyme (TIGR03279 family)